MRPFQKNDKALPKAYLAVMFLKVVCYYVDMTVVKAMVKRY